MACNLDLKPIRLTIELDEYESRGVVLREDRVCLVLGRPDEGSELFDTDSLLEVRLACEQTNAIGDNRLSSGVAFSFRFVGLKLAFRNVRAMIDRVVVAGLAVSGREGSAQDEEAADNRRYVHHDDPNDELSGLQTRSAVE